MLMMSGSCVKQTCLTTFSADTIALCRVQRLTVALALGSLGVTWDHLGALGIRAKLCSVPRDKMETQQELQSETNSAPVSHL